MNSRHATMARVQRHRAFQDSNVTQQILLWMKIKEGRAQLFKVVPAQVCLTLLLSLQVSQELCSCISELSLSTLFWRCHKCHQSIPSSTDSQLTWKEAEWISITFCSVLCFFPISTPTYPVTDPGWALDCWGRHKLTAFLKWPNPFQTKWSLMPWDKCWYSLLKGLEQFPLNATQVFLERCPIHLEKWHKFLLTGHKRNQKRDGY